MLDFFFLLIEENAFKLYLYNKKLFFYRVKMLILTI